MLYLTRHLSSLSGVQVDSHEKRVSADVAQFESDLQQGEVFFSECGFGCYSHSIDRNNRTFLGAGGDQLANNQFDKSTHSAHSAHSATISK